MSLLGTIPKTTITIKKISGYTGLNEPVFSVQSNISAYVEFGFKKVVDQFGNEITSNGFVMVDSSVDISAGDYVLIDSLEYSVIDAQPVPHPLGGIDHIEIYLTGVKS